MSVTVEELLQLFDGADAELVREIHSEARGNRIECVSQLSAITGIEPQGMGSPEATSDSTGGGGGVGAGAQVDYDSVLATGEEKAELERKRELNDLIRRKIDDIAVLAGRDREFQAEVERQRKLGAQSTRKHKIDTAAPAGGNKYYKRCFDEMLANEARHAGEFVCFYHSYSFAALIYEIQTAIARTAYGLDETFAPLPRLLKKPFVGKPHMNVLLAQFKSMSGQDHDPNFRAVAISVSCSLEATASEAPPMQCFAQGYSCNDLVFTDVVLGIFRNVGASDSEAKELMRRVLDVCTRYNLHAQCYGGSPQYSYTAGAGHMLQIFIRRDCVDDVAYGSHAFGVYDEPRNPLSQYMLRPEAPDGQARIFWHPALFCDPTKTRLYHYAADEKFATNRVVFQRELLEALKPLFNTPQRALRTYYALEGLSE